ncbi:MAG: trypsin-like peptidase domain-containing protein [Planctomycetes bacterium]|nr:trypsin-like peptidase domain-containing protein [Planctomycetota bacterium]
MLVTSACLLLALALPSPGDDPVEFVLSGGAAVKGAVLKETASTVWVDVGHTVLEIPTGSILERRAVDAVAASDATEEKGLYATGGQERLSVHEAVERFGEGVVVVRTPMGTGSGFVIREDGYVVTNAHVVQGEIEVSVVLYLESDDGFEKKILERCKIVAVNPWVDLALLKIDEDELGDTKLTRVVLGSSDETEVGEPVFAVGAPLGMDRSVSEGIVSTKNRSMDGKIYVQTTAAVNPGNSGGPLFNARGEVIAVNTLGYMFFEGLNMSIPVDAVKHFIDNRDAFAYDRDNPNSGYRYLQPPGRPKDGSQP